MLQSTDQRRKLISDHLFSKLMSTSLSCDKDNKCGNNFDTTAQPVTLLCFDLHRIPRIIQFVILTTATFVFYIVYGYMQELIFRLDGFRPFGWYLTLIQFACYSVFGITEMQFKKNKLRKIPIRTYLFVAFLTVATMGLSNTSVGYLNYPTQVIFKCCKLIPVFIGGIVIQGKRFDIVEMSACMLMTLGLILFVLADSTMQPNFHFYGVVLICLALCADGVIGNMQEKSMKKHDASSTEMVMYSYGLGFFYILFTLIITGNLIPAFLFCRKYPMETYGYAVIFSVTGYFGVNIVLSLVKNFGALMAVTVTTCRKAVTIVMSFLFFTKPFSMQYFWSGMVVILGIYFHIYSKNKETWNTCVERTFKYLRKIVQHNYRTEESIV